MKPIPITTVRSGVPEAEGEATAGAPGDGVGDEGAVAVATPVDTDVAGLQAQMKAVSDQKTKFVVLRVLRGIHTRYLELQSNWDTVK